jgi:hypothetical protein
MVCQFFTKADADAAASMVQKQVESAGQLASARLHSGTFAESWFASSLELSADFAESLVLTITRFAENWSVLLKVCTVCWEMGHSVKLLIIGMNGQSMPH